MKPNPDYVSAPYSVSWMSTYLPLPGRLSRKRRRHWKRQILKNHPGMNGEWLEAAYGIRWLYEPRLSYKALEEGKEPIIILHLRKPVDKPAGLD